MACRCQCGVPVSAAPAGSERWSVCTSVLLSQAPCRWRNLPYQAQAVHSQDPAEGGHPLSLQAPADAGRTSFRLVRAALDLGEC